MILGLCDRFKKLPSEILNEDASLLRLLKIERLGKPEPDEDVTDE